MRKSLLFCCFSILMLSVAAQPGSVTLKDGNGATQGTFNSILEAYNAIPSTITEPYLIELSAGYNGSTENTIPVALGVKSGSSSTNTITIRPEVGATNVSLIKTASGANVITINDADFIIIDGRPGGVGSTRALTITNQGTSSNSNVIQLINGATNNVIRYCNLSSSGSGNATRTLGLSTSASNPTGNSHNRFEYNLHNGGRYTINSNGTAANPNVNNVFYASDIVNFPFAGIWLQAGTGKTFVDSCRFYHTATVGDGPYGILFDSQSDSAIIRHNTMFNFTNAGTSLVKGISVRSSTAATNNQVYIYNNFINLGTGSFTSSINVSGIEFTSTNATNVGNATILYNTIVVGGNLTSGGTAGNVVSSGILKTSSTPGSVYVIRNNIIVNNRTGGTSGTQHVALALSNTAGSIDLDYNTYNSASGNLVRFGTNVYTDMASYQAAAPPGTEMESNDVPVQFVSAADLHLSGTSIGNASLRAQPVADIPNDIDFEPRGSVPYRGADEATTPLPVQMQTFTAVRVNKDVRVDWSTLREMNVSRFYVERSTDGTRFTSVASVEARGNSQNVTSYTATDAGAATLPHRYLLYRLRVVDADGRYTYTPVVRINLNAGTELQVQVYPNPTAGEASLLLNSAKGGTATVRTMDVSGKLIATQTHNVVVGANLFKVPGMDRAGRGMYFVQVIFDGQSSTTRLIRQ